MGAIDNPKREIFCVEIAAGLTPEDAYVVAGMLHHDGRGDDDPAPQRRSRSARLCIKMIERRIGFLEACEPDSFDSAELHRRLRAVCELRWCRDIVKNGGAEPDEWREDHAEDEPEFDVAS